jgi:hypothetical protein
MITATFNVSKADVLALSLYYYASSSTVRRSRILNQASVPFLLVLIAALGFFREPGPFVLVSPLLIIAAIWALFYPRLHRWYLRQTAERFLNEASYQKAFGSYTLSLNEKGIGSSSPVGEGNYLWSCVSRVSLTPEYLFIFLAGPQGYPIPRAQVPDATIQEIRAFAEKMSQRAEPGAAPNGGPAAPVGNSKVTEGPSSVS